VQRAILTLFTGCVRILVAHRGTTRLLLLLSFVGLEGPPRFPWQRSVRSLTRISVRNGFTRPTGDINVNSPPYTQRPSREENLNENLLCLQLFLRGPAHSEPPSSSFMGSDLRMRGSPSRTANSDRGSLKESNPLLTKRPRKGKTSIRKFVFFRKVCEAAREPQVRDKGSSLNSACRSKTRSMPC
jgi:hypothetical protein